MRSLGIEMDFTNLIISLLEKYNIPYQDNPEESHNTSEKCIGVQCPFCDDHSDHMGIFKENLAVSCRRCGLKGDFAYLLAILTNRTKEICREEILSFSEISFEKDAEQQILEILYGQSGEEAPKEPTKVIPIKFPDYFVPIEKLDSPLLDSYIQKRRISREILIGQGCGICQAGKFMNRLIVPVFFEGQLVAYQGADLTGRSEIKYKADSKDSKIKEYFFRWDKLNRNLEYVIIVEGLMDSLRLLGNTLASFGTSLTSAQIKRLIKLNPKKLIFAYDGDAYLESERFAQEFSPFIEEVYTIELPYYWKNFEERVDEDPDSFGAENVWNLIQETCNI